MDFLNQTYFLEDEVECIEEYRGSSIYDALIYTYHLYEEVNLEEIARLTSSSIEKVLEELDEHLFLNPYLFDKHHDLYRDYILDIHYMMGNLYDRYKEAYLMNIKYGGLFEKNLSFLKRYISDISLKQMLDAQTLFKNEVSEIYQYFHTKQYRYKKNLNLITLLEDNDILYKNNSSSEIHALLYEYINKITKNKGYKHLMGYALTSFNHDPFYMMLMRKKNIIVETDVEKRLYILLLSACLLINHFISDEVTIIVSANVKRILMDMKYQLYPHLKGIHIICAHEFRGDEKYIIYDCSANYQRKIVHYMASIKYCAFFLDNLVDHQFIEDFIKDFVNEKEEVYKVKYENGFIVSSPDYNSLSFKVHRYKDCIRLFQQLSPYLIYHASSIVDYELQFYNNVIHDVDARLCINNQKIKSQELEKKRQLLTLMGDLNEVQEFSKYQRIIESIYLYACYEYERQLVYCDHYDLNQVKEDLIKLGFNKNDIQIITPRSSIKNCKVYLTKTNYIYPFQIKDLNAIHHIDLPETLHQLYSRNACIKQYIYIVKESIDSYILQKLFYDCFLHDEYHHEFTLSKKLYRYYLLSFDNDSYLTNKHAYIQNKRLEDKFFMIDTKRSLIELDKIVYPKFNLQHLTKHQKMNYEKKVNDLIQQDYFDKKERYLFTLGSYQVFLPKNMLKDYTYLLLVNKNTFLYPINQSFSIKELIHYLKERENRYEENEYRTMSNHVRELI